MAKPLGGGDVSPILQDEARMDEASGPQKGALAQIALLRSGGKGVLAGTGQDRACAPGCPPTADSIPAGEGHFPCGPSPPLLGITRGSSFRRASGTGGGRNTVGPPPQCEHLGSVLCTGHVDGSRRQGMLFSLAWGCGCCPSSETLT